MEAIPVVDLRLLSQAELNTLSLSSSSDPRRRLDDAVVPKIDRSVFNESAGSRKQTYSRLRLAPRNPDLPSSSSSSSSGNLHRSVGLAPSAPPPPVVVDPGRRENKQIVHFLRRLFAKNGVETVDATPINDGITANSNRSSIPNTALGKRGTREEAAAAGVSDAEKSDREVLNINGVPVDAVGLGEKEDLFGSELRRQTEGLATEAEFLGYLTRLEGQWGSTRKRRKVVDSANFGDGLPKGWKVLLGLKRKEGSVWVHCRRYISPSGKQFTSCKEVSSYLLSFPGPQDLRQSNLGQKDEATLRVDKLAVGITHQENIARGSSNCCSGTIKFSVPADSKKQTDLFRVEDPENLLECQKCNLTFSDKEERVRHLLKFHRKNAKRRRLGKSIGDGVIIKDGKFECQFCHKTFTERHRYNGHVGIHVKYSGKNLETSPDIVMEKSIGSSSSAGMPLAVSEVGVSVDYEKEQNSLQELHSPIKVNSPPSRKHIENKKIDCSPKCCNHEKERNLVQEICTANFVGEINNSFPQGNELIENNKFDCNAECLDHEKDNNSVQEICTNQPMDEIHNGSPQKDEHLEDQKMDCKPKYCPSEVIHETSKRRTSHDQFDDYDKADLNQRIIAETSNDMDMELNACLDATALCLVNKGNSASEISTEKVFSASIAMDEIEKSSTDQKVVSESNMPDSGSVPSGMVHFGSFIIDETEKSSYEQKLLVDGNLTILLGSEQSNTSDILAGQIKNQQPSLKFRSFSQAECDLECSQVLSDRDVVLENDMLDEIVVSGNEQEIILENCLITPLGGGRTCAIETSMDDMPANNVKEAVLEKMDKSGEELDVGLEINHVLSNIDARKDMIGRENIMQNLAVNMLSSWMQLSACIPDFSMSSNQGESELDNVNQKHEKISGFEELRLDDIEPHRHVIKTGGDSRPELKASMELAFDAAALENSLGPDIQQLQLGWGTTLPEMVHRRRQLTTAVCIWCSGEFEHEGIDLEVQPDSLGFICPACKAKISGQINVLGDMSGK